MKKLLPLLLLLAAFCWPHDEAHATACTAGCVQFVNTSSTTATTITTTITGVTSGHNLRVFAVMASVPSAITFGGTAGIFGTTKAVNGSINVVVGIPSVSPGGGSIAVVITAPTITGSRVQVEEWAGDTIGSFDGENATYTNGAGSNPTPTGNIVSTSTGTVTVEAFSFSLQFNAPTAPAGFTTATNNVAATGIITTYETVTNPGTTNPTFTANASTFDSFVVGAGFDAAGGGPTCPLSRTLVGAGC